VGPQKLTAQILEIAASPSSLPHASSSFSSFSEKLSLFLFHIIFLRRILTQARLLSSNFALGKSFKRTENAKVINIGSCLHFMGYIG
jgi:hypothetical protein